MEPRFGVTVIPLGSGRSDPVAEARRAIVGEPDEVAERLSSLLDVGFTVLNLMVGGRRDEQLERLGTEVLPAVRRRAGHRSV